MKIICQQVILGNIMPYLFCLKKQQNLKLSSAANYRWRFMGQSCRIQIHQNTMDECPFIFNFVTDFKNCISRCLILAIFVCIAYSAKLKYPPTLSILPYTIEFGYFSYVTGRSPFFYHLSPFLLCLSAGNDWSPKYKISFWVLGMVFCCLFDLILYVPSTIFQLCRVRSSWVEPVLS